jgi:hypothetical protein
MKASNAENARVVVLTLHGASGQLATVSASGAASSLIKAAGGPTSNSLFSDAIKSILQAGASAGKGGKRKDKSLFAMRLSEIMCEFFAPFLDRVYIFHFARDQPINAYIP